MNPGEKIGDKLTKWTEKAKQFYQDVRQEMRKVSWPSRQEVQSTTIVVIAAVVFFGIYLGAVDVGLNAGIGWVLRFFNVAS